MRRAMLVWRRQAPDRGGRPDAGADSQFYEHDRGASLEQIRGIAQEYAAIVMYWWRGWI